MKKQRILFLIILIITLILFNNIVVTRAEEDPESMIKLQQFADRANITTEGDPLRVTLNIINAILAFLGLFFLILIIYAGFQWMMSGGNEEIITKARKRLINAIIGLLIVLGSWIIANTIINIIQHGTFYDPNAGWINIF